MSFSKDKCLALFREVNHTQASIEGASAKILFWKKHAKEVVHYWDVVFRESAPPKKLNLVYVANDLLQKSRAGRGSREFAEEFFRVLPTALRHMIKHCDAKVQQRLKRVVDVWGDREVFGRTAMREFKGITGAIGRPDGAASSSQAPAADAAPQRAHSSGGGAVAALAAAEVAVAASLSAEHAAGAALSAFTSKVAAGGARDGPEQAAALTATRRLMQAREAQAAAHSNAAEALSLELAAQHSALQQCTQQQRSNQATLQQLERALAATAQARVLAALCTQFAVPQLLPFNTVTHERLASAGTAASSGA